MKRRPLLTIASLSLLGRGAQAAAHEIHYPQASASDPLAPYVDALLRRALGRESSRFELSATDDPELNQQRTLEQLALGQGKVQMLWSMTSSAREAVLAPIRIPIDRGLLGWRVPLIRAGNQGIWAGLQADTHLRQLLGGMVAGQGADWPDTEILRANGLAVVTSTRYSSLFGMLAHGRFDYFPRSVLEIEEEAQRYAALGLVIAPRALLIYPTATYCFVSRAEPEFGRLLSAGLLRLARNGELAAVFKEHFEPTLRRLNLRERLALRLDNPLLPRATPLTRRELWEQP